MNPVLGLFGIIGIWATMAMVPLIEVLGLTSLEATFLRGISGVVIVGVWSFFQSGLITRPDRNTLRIVACFVLATFCLFQAVAAWGANFSALFLDLAVLVPLFLLWRQGKVIDRFVMLALLIAIIGTVMALQVFGTAGFSITGLLWSLGALVANGLFIQYAGQAKQENWNKAFWMSVGLVVVGSPALGQWFVADGGSLSANVLLLGLLFAVTTGVLNFYSAFVAFRHLSAVAVGVMILGVTPVIMLSSYFMLGRTMGPDQLFGVALTLGAVLMFGAALRKQAG